MVKLEVKRGDVFIIVLVLVGVALLLLLDGELVASTGEATFDDELDEDEEEEEDEGSFVCWLPPAVTIFSTENEE